MYVTRVVLRFVRKLTVICGCHLVFLIWAPAQHEAREDKRGLILFLALCTGNCRRKIFAQLWSMHPMEWIANEYIIQFHYSYNSQLLNHKLRRFPCVTVRRERNGRRGSIKFIKFICEMNASHMWPTVFSWGNGWQVDADDELQNLNYFSVTGFIWIFELGQQ